MSNEQPILDPATHYRIEVRDRVGADWLQSFGSSVEIIVDDSAKMEDVTVLHVHTDQSGIVGLLRQLHGLGLTILQLQLITGKEKSM